MPVNDNNDGRVHDRDKENPLEESKGLEEEEK